ncbi:hypothetical protein KP509_1Z003000 [Ceratopteris richardii]|nr:hypothetical protein KP509_1Z003000 [Ceratopteris richardii]
MADDSEVQRLAEAAFRDSDNSVIMAFRVSKSRGKWGVSGGRRSSLASKQRVLALTSNNSINSKNLRVNLQVLKVSSRGLQPAKVYKLKHLSKIEAVQNDNTGCTFVLGFDNLTSQSVAPAQWTMRSLDDRNRFLTCIMKLSKENLGRLPKIIGMDVVEMALWAQANAKAHPPRGPADVEDIEIVDDPTEGIVTVEKDLFLKVEEEDMQALLDTYVMGIDEAEAFSERLKRELLALEAANVHAILESEPLVEEVLHQLSIAASSVDDLDEWLRMFNVKLRHMREDIQSIEVRNNKLDMQEKNNSALVHELNELLDRLKIPDEYVSSLTVGSFDEARMPQTVEACEWLSQSLHALEPPYLDGCYLNMRAVKDKRAELFKLKTTFVKRASEFLRNYFTSLVDFMVNDKSYFSQRGQLKRPDHADLRFKCRTYARLLQHLKNLDKSSLIPLRKAYCHSLNLLLRREAREFGNELRASTKVTRNPNSSGAWMDGSTGGQSSGGPDTSTVSDAYAKMLRIFIPLLVDESTFFASFMCFDVLPLVPPGPTDRRMSEDKDDDQENASGVSSKSSERDSAEFEALNQSLRELLDGTQANFYAVVEWAYKSDPLRCISMQCATERFLSSQKADAAGFVRQLLVDLQAKINACFNRFIDEACHQTEKQDRNMKQTGVLTCIPSFAALAQRMEDLVQNNSREMVDAAYTKLVNSL